MNKQDNINMGEEIKNIVQDAVNKGDFKRLNSDIRNVVDGALAEVRKSIEWKRERQNNLNNQNNHINQKSINQNYNKQNYNNQNINNKNYNTKNTYQNYAQRTYNNKPISKATLHTVPVGQVSGVLLTVFGILGSVVFGIAFTVLMILGSVIGLSSVFYTIAYGLFPLFIVCIVLWMNGNRIRKRLKRFRRYVSQLHGRNYCLIKDLSSATGLSNRYTIKDLRRMTSIGMFPQGRIDEKKTCFMLNNESYGQYLKLQDNMRMKQIEEKNNQYEVAPDTTAAGNIKDLLKPEERKVIEDGRKFVSEIRNANIAIPGEEISRKLDRLEEVTDKIFDFVETHPEKIKEIKKFTEYFLPTTLKLLDAYRELDHQPIQGDNIASAKKEIEETMDTINLAFENLLDDLFEASAMDISTDISVLETMLVQEGLTSNSIRTKNTL